MRVFYKVLLAFATAASLTSCATVGRFLSASSEKSDISAEELSSKWNPKGTLVDVRHKTSVKGPSARRMLVYLPKGYYEHPEKRYPVLYVLHGARGNETSWIQEGHIIALTDSLIAQRKVRPFIIVMPNMNQYNNDKDFANSRFKRPAESFIETNGAVETGFMKDVVGTVDSLFRTVPDKEHRAIAGLSIGGLQAIYLSANHPFSFDAIALLSPMHKAFIALSEYNDFYRELKGKQQVQFSIPPRLYSIFIGKKDIFYFNIEYYRKYLHWNDFPFQYTEIRGGHEWKCWRIFYEMFVQDCFK